MTRSEHFVTKFCQQAFLSPWTYANPQQHPVRTKPELCDVLVSFESSIVLFSVKESSSNRGLDSQSAWNRWDREALQNSVKQLRGAERWLKNGGSVTQCDGSTPIILPVTTQLEIFRVAVAFGFGGQAPVLAVHEKHGPTFILDEVSLPIVFSELDTVADFIEYLRVCTQLFHRGIRTVVNGGEHNMLACYLCNGRRFPDEADILVIEDNFWDSFRSSDGYQRRTEENRVSYVWDSLIEVIAATRSDWTMHGSHSDGPRKMLLEAISSENRFRRRMLGRALVEFLGAHQELRARFISVESGRT